MKKIIALVIAIIAILTFTYTVCAEETDVNEQITVTEEQEKGIIDAIINSTVWGSLISYALMAGGIVVFVYKKFGSVIALVKSGKADTTTVLNGVKNAIDESFEKIQTELASTKVKLAETEENEKKLTAILCMYIANDTRYNPTAKAEIMKYTSGIKGFAGTVEQICNEAQKAIEEAQKNEVKIETPVLDEIVSEANDHEIMSLV